ncbi:hypothetical protein HY793_00835 [Candidatus Desantisbacteria bacterium]|nr:hypothetical protein [Candidatus Desantisbacteria bacterium]
MNHAKNRLNLRQEKTIKHIIKNGKMTVNKYQSVASCIRRTAQRDLEELIAKGIVEAVVRSTTDTTKHYVLL